MDVLLDLRIEVVTGKVLEFLGLTRVPEHRILNVYVLIVVSVNAVNIVQADDVEVVLDAVANKH